jgi:predicted Zn-dependent protease with MMP-like domain
VAIIAREFERLVAEGLATISEELLGYISNVQITIEDKPNDELLDAHGIAREETLFGLYEGTPLTERTTEISALSH